MPAKRSAPRIPVRLGDDLPAAPDRRPGEAVNLVVARTTVMGGKVRLKVEAPKRLRGGPGARLLVKHVYRLQEGSTEREEFRILLRSTLDGRDHAPSLARFGDNYALPDDYSGFLVHEHRLPAAREARLEFEVAAEYTVGDWKDVHVQAHRLERAHGDVVIELD